MKKGLKIFLIIFASAIIIVGAVVAYVVFGVLGPASENIVYADSQTVEDNEGTSKTVIDEDTAYQSINGFGISSSQWASIVGGWDNCKDILELLYDDDIGIGLNIYRYNLGAGSLGDSQIADEKNTTECFMDADGNFDFSADANAQKALQDARDLAGIDLRVTLFCNSPPVSLTQNGLAYGSASLIENTEQFSNISSDNYETFANFCYQCADYFLDENYRVCDVSPVNEPQYSHSAEFDDDGKKITATSEGCYYNEDDLTSLYKAMFKRFNGTAVSEQGCEISAFESCSITDDDGNFTQYLQSLLSRNIKYMFKNELSRKNLSTITYHSYYASSEDKLATAQFMQDNYASYSLSCTEYTQKADDENSGVYDLIACDDDKRGVSIEYGVAMAQKIIEDLTILNATEWDWGTACSFDDDTSGLIYLDENDCESIQISKRLWCLGNFSKFINEGAVRIAASSGVEGLDCVAFKNESGEIVIVYVNSSDDELSTSLVVNDACVYVTDETHDLECTQSNINGEATVTIPPLSVLTVVTN